MTRADWVLAGIVTLLLPWLYLSLWTAEGQGQWVRIWSSQQQATMVPLHEDRVLHIEGALGESTIVIKDGQVRFSDSPCNSKNCVRTGWLQNSGEVAACLPNEISIQLVGNIAGYDAINF